MIRKVDLSLFYLYYIVWRLAIQVRRCYFLFQNHRAASSKPQLNFGVLLSSLAQDSFFFTLCLNKVHWYHKLPNYCFLWPLCAAYILLGLGIFVWNVSCFTCPCPLQWHLPWQLLPALGAGHMDRCKYWSCCAWGIALTSRPWCWTSDALDWRQHKNHREGGLNLAWFPLHLLQGRSRHTAPQW